MSENPIQSAERLFGVLEALAQEDSISLTELSEILGLHKSTVHRLLKSLICMGYAEQDPQTSHYRLTYKILALSSACYSKNRLINRVHPYLESLSAQCHETVHFVKKSGHRLLYLDKVESHEYVYQMYSRIGIFNELYCCASGKALLAVLPDDQIRELWPALQAEARTPYTITSLDTFLAELRTVRENGYAHDRQESEMGLYSIGAAISDFTGKANYAVSITSHISRITDITLSRNIRLLKETTSALSQELGYQSLR